MKKSLFPLFILSLFSISSSAQILHGSTTVSLTNNMTIDVTVNVPQNEVTLILSGPSNVWFGYGFGSNAMLNTYSIITTGSGAISERRLGNHNGGTLLTSSLNSSTNIVVGMVRTDTIKRSITGLNSNYFSFPTTPSSFMVIWGRGTGSSLANHGGGNRGSAMVTLSTLCTNTLTSLSDTSICFGDSLMLFGEFRNLAGLYSDTLQTPLGCDSIIEQELKIGSNPGPYMLPDVSICDGDSVMIFGTFQMQAGVYFDTLQNQVNCDSIVAVELKKVVLDTTINYVLGDTRLLANQDSATYQWLENCDSAPTPIPGATDSILIDPTDTIAYYAVIITKDGCVDTSECVQYFHILSLPENQKIISSTFPNPASDYVEIDLRRNFKELTVKLIDLSGAVVYKEVFFGVDNLQLNLERFRNGIYSLQLEADDIFQMQKIVKQ